MATELRRNPRASIRNRWEAIKRCLFEPDRFFDEHVGEYGIRNEFLLVLAISVAGGIGMIYAASALLEPFSTGPAGDGVRVDENTVLNTWGLAIRQALLPFLFWLFYTLVFYAGSWLYSGRGTFFETVKYTAWGLLPLLFANLLSTIAAIYTFWQLEVDTEVPGSPDENAQFLFDQGLGEPLMLAASALTLVFLAWCGYIWRDAVAHAQDINRDEAAKIVAVAVILHAGYVVWDLLGTGGFL